MIQGRKRCLKDCLALAGEMEGSPHLERLLPYGDTLHYEGCGCPEHWTAGTRPADVVDSLAQAMLSPWIQAEILHTEDDKRVTWQSLNVMMEMPANAQQMKGKFSFWELHV